eukprot:g7927.t1
MRSLRNRLKESKKDKDGTTMQDEPEGDLEERSNVVSQDLSLKISHATQLPSMDLNGFSDPFCFIIVGDRRFKTSVKKKTLNPVWNETFIIPEKDLRKTQGEVLLEVFDKDEWTSNDFIGMTQFNAFDEVRDHGEELMTFKLEQYPSKKLIASNKTASSQENLGEVNHPSILFALISLQLAVLVSWTSSNSSLGHHEVSSPILGERLAESRTLKLKESNALPVEGMVHSLPSIVHSSRGSIFEEPAVAALILQISEVELHLTPCSLMSLVGARKCIIKSTKERAKRHMNRVLDGLNHARNQGSLRQALSYYRSHRTSSSSSSSSLRSSSSTADKFFKSILQEDTSSSDDENSSLGEVSESGDDSPPVLTDQEIESDSQWYYKVTLLHQTRSSETVNYRCNSGMKMNFGGYVCFVVQLPLANVDVQISMCRKCHLSRRDFSIPFNCSLFGILNNDNHSAVSSEHGSMEVQHKLISLDRRPNVLHLLQVKDPQSGRQSVTPPGTPRSDPPTPNFLKAPTHNHEEVNVKQQETLVGNLEIFLDYIELSNVKSTVQSCFCVLKCAQHWALTTSQTLDSIMQWKWLIKIPVYEPATVLSLAVFGESGRVRQLTRLGKLRVRLSTLEPGKEADCQLAFVSEGVEIGTAKLALKLTYPSDLGLIKGYLRSEFQDDIYNYNLNIGTAKSIIKKERRKIVVQWLDTSEPRIPSTVSTKVLDLEREVFSRKRLGVHIKRIQQCFSFFPMISKKMESLQSWENPFETIAVILGIWIGLFNVNAVLIISFLLAFLALSISYSASKGPPSMTDPVLMASTDHSGGNEEKSHEVSNPYSALKSRYDQIQSILIRIQKILDSIASFSERIHALLTWRDPVATRALTVVLLFAFLAIALLGLQTCIACGVCWLLRPPILRDPFPPAPLNFFKRLPSRSDQIL